MRTLLVQAPWQGREPLSAQDLSDGRRAQGTVTLLKDLADFINGVVLFAELEDQVMGGRFLGLGLGTVVRGNKEEGRVLTAEVVAQDIKRIERIAESTCHVFGRAILDDESAECFVLAMLRQFGF
jgi:hypothetical protein